MSDLKKQRHLLSVYTIAVIVTAIALTFVSLYFYSQVDKQWRLYSTDAQQVYSLHDTLIQKMGYGGFIHDFKNLVLRKDIERYEPLLNQNLQDIKLTLEKLKEFNQYTAESIKVISKTVTAYEQKLNVVLVMIGQGKSSEQIDAVVKVDDLPALKALAQFDSQLNSRLTKEGKLINNHFSVAYSVHIASIIIFLCLFAIYFINLISANKKEHELTNKALEGARVKSDFLANMSHEIRTPLNGIMGALQLLQGNLKQVKNIDLASKALISCRALLTIINDILDFSKIEANRIDIERVDFSLGEVLEGLSSNILPLASDKRISFAIEKDNNMSDLWVGDPVRVGQILLNLTSNAVKFTETGGVTVSVCRKQLNDIDGINFVVTDTGIGMSEEALFQLFERFTQADSSITRKFGGTGLGMAITKNLVTLMGGKITATSGINQGTQVSVFLPLPQSDKNTLVSEEQTITPPDLKHLSILVAEDNALNTVIIKAMMEATNASLHFVTDGAEAVEQFTEFSPDLILMDIQMPKMDGMEACRRIRGENGDIPIIAITANVMKNDVLNYHHIGFNSHIAKPIDKNVLYKTLKSFADNSNGSDS